MTERRQHVATDIENRVAAHAAMVRAAIASGQKVDRSGPIGDLERLEADLALAPFEHAAYQTAQVRAHARGVLSTAEALTVYRALGDYPSSEGDSDRFDAPMPDPSNGGWAAETDLATKVTVTTLMGSLIGKGKA